MNPQYVRGGLAAALIAASITLPVQAGALTSTQDLTSQGAFPVDEDGNGNTSAIVCGPPATKAGACLFVDDETENAQFATLDLASGILSAGQTVLITKGTGTEPVSGHEPDRDQANPPLCDKPGAPGEFDGEAIAATKDAYYVVGSHGCGRKGLKFKLSVFMVARITPGAEAAATPKVELTYVLANVLAAAFPKTFGRNLKDANGLNIEGAAIVGDDFYVGLRGPTDEQGAYVVSIPTASLFPASDEATPQPKPPSRLLLGEGIGIRDIATIENHMADGSNLLILAGPQQKKGDYSLRLATAAGSSVTLGASLGELPSPPTTKDGTKLLCAADLAPGDIKAEAIHVLSTDPATGELTVLVMYDGPVGGCPQIFKVKQP